MSDHDVKIQVESGVHGVSWVKREIQSHKPLRKMLAVMVMQSMKSAENLTEQGSLLCAHFDNMDELLQALQNGGSIKLAFAEMSQGLLNSAPGFDSEIENMFGVSLQLANSAIMLAARFYSEVDYFMKV